MQKIIYSNRQSKRTIPDYILADRINELRKEFHPKKNGEKNIEQFPISSGKKVWWICEKGHEWESVFNTRTVRGYGCPICSGQKIVFGINDFATLFPSIACEVHPTKNVGIDITKLGGKSSKKIWWLCSKNHEYEQAIAKRTGRGYGCPYCSGRYPVVGMNDLYTCFPELSLFWDYEENGNMQNFSSKSRKRVSWKCGNGHKWNKSIFYQKRKNICPYCNGSHTLIDDANSIETKYPELAKEWCVEKNGCELSNAKLRWKTKLYWKCQNEHVWKTEFGNRIAGKGCPYCAGKYPIIGTNDLASLHPELVKEWDYDKNRRKPEEYLPKSNVRVYWKCINGHSWRALICERTRGTGCPECKRIYK